MTDQSKASEQQIEDDELESILADAQDELEEATDVVASIRDQDRSTIAKVIV